MLQLNSPVLRQNSRGGRGKPPPSFTPAYLEMLELMDPILATAAVDRLVGGHLGVSL